MATQTRPEKRLKRRQGKRTASSFGACQTASTPKVRALQASTSVARLPCSAVGRLSLSGGQRQRLAIARALLKKPKILALDEATSALDATSERRVNDAIDKILRSRQTTCLFIAHRLSTIARAERIVVLEGGRITESGTFRELVAQENSRFRALMAAQLNAAAGESLLGEHDVREEEDEEVEFGGEPVEQGSEEEAKPKP